MFLLRWFCRLGGTENTFLKNKPRYHYLEKAFVDVRITQYNLAELNKFFHNTLMRRTNKAPKPSEFLVKQKLYRIRIGDNQRNTRPS